MDIKQFWDSFWDFKNYSEKGWFKFLVILLTLVGALYIYAHWKSSAEYDLEYTSLNKGQIQLVNRIYLDATDTTASAGKKDTLKIKVSKSTKSNQKVTKPAKIVDTSKKDTSKQKDTNPPAKKTKDTLVVKRLNDCDCNTAKADKIVRYLENEFSGKWDKNHKERVYKFLITANAFEATTFLANTRYEIQSYFWLIGPSVYFEIIFWAFFGVVCSLLFNLGFVSKESTTDFTNFRSVFDSTEIPFQVAKIMYAPICTLVIVLGYNYFNDENIVDISSSKGVIVFAFIGGFYSSRVIALMDRLKDVILPNNGTADLSTKTPPEQQVNDLKFVLGIDPSVVITPALQAALDANALNNAIVKLQPIKTVAEINAARSANDAAATYTVQSLVAGIYKVVATLDIDGDVYYSETITTVKPSSPAISILLKNQ